ncbi:MAG: hypothetical protein ACI8QY_000540, partial [bacterium]
VQDVNHFMHEVEEAMHVETMLNFWNSYKIHLIAAFASLFVAVTSWQWYSVTLEDGLVKQADNLWTIERTGDNTTESYTQLLENGSEGYKLIAILKATQNKIDAGNVNAALTMYDAIIMGDTADEFKQLATYYKGVALLPSENEKASALFSEIVASEGAFVMSAKEMLGIIAEQNGELFKAKKYYENIIINPAIPQGLRGRVQSRIDFINRVAKKV